MEVSNQSHTVGGVSLIPQPSHTKQIASQQTGSEQENQNPPQYVAPQEHIELMQIPSNSMPPGENGRDIQKNGEDFFTEEPIDSESIKGIFGWETVDDTSIPYILRKQKKFVSVRIVERKLLSKYPNTFPDELGKKDPLVSYFITEAEASLLNEINTAHCDFEYGNNPFTDKDLIVDLDEFEEFFKIVKKTFPADVLAKINEEPTPSVMSPPVKTELSQFCGWIQINNTVSPYIIRFDNGKQVKLVPLSVIVYAAGLLNNSNVDGLLPTSHECAMLNEACKAAGFDFLFGMNTRLISISEVLQRCQVQLFELPFKNPLQHARYLDPCTGQPSSSPLIGHRSSHPLVKTMPIQQQPPAPMRPQGSMDFLTGNPAQHNSYTSAFPQSAFHPSQMTMTGGLSGIPGAPLSYQGPPSPSMMHFLRSQAGMGMEPSHLQSPRPQIVTDKNIDNYNLMKQGLPGSLWAIMPRMPPPAHVNNTVNSAIVSEAPSIIPDPPITSIYQPHSLPPNPLLHSMNSPTMPDLNHQIFRGLMGMPQRPLATQSINKDPPGGLGRYNSPAMGIPPPQYSVSQSYPFRVNQFDNSLHPRTNLKDQRPISNSTILPGQPRSQHHTGSESVKHSAPHPTKNVNQNNSKASSALEPGPHIITSMHSSNFCNNRQSNIDFSHTISACLVNGKSISCINVDLPQRKGKFCLVEAVSKLYFPTIPLTEFVKVLLEVLKVNLHECTSQEEAAFVQYYNLPVNKLKCNKIIRVDDLEMYFPQLNYIFTKCSSDSTQGQADSHLSSTANSAQKRRSSSTTTGPPEKITQLKIENVEHVLNYGRDTTQNGGTSDSGAGFEAPVIVIDDE